MGDDDDDDDGVLSVNIEASKLNATSYRILCSLYLCPHSQNISIKCRGKKLNRVYDVIPILYALISFELWEWNEYTHLMK